MAITDVQKEEIIRLINPKGFTSTVLDYQFNVIEDRLRKGDHAGASLHALRLGYFADNLNKLKRHNPSAFASVARDLKNSRNDDHAFYGFRFEAYIASRIARSKVEFFKTESPDFEIEYNGKSYIECSSARFRGGRISDDFIFKKVFDLIFSKASKPYAKRECALFLDITNLLFNLPPNTWQEKMDSFEAIACKHIEVCNFGAILVFT